MELNKRCISAFAKNNPFVALATKSKLLDPTFLLTSELILINYMSGKIYPSVTTDLKFCKLLWCEFNGLSYLAAGHENGAISIYELKEEGLVLLKSRTCSKGDVNALDFLVSKSVLVAGSSKGEIIFWTLSNLEKEYALDIELSMDISAITCNPKVSKILCVGSKDGIIKVLDIKKNSVIMTLNNKDFMEVKSLEWDVNNNTKLIVMSEKGYLSEFDLSNDSITKKGNFEESLIGFYKNILVSRNMIDNKGHITNILESFDCSISKRDPVICLSHVNGVTSILSIPFVKKNIPFTRHRNNIIGFNTCYRLVIEDNKKYTIEDDFYLNLLKKCIEEKVDLKETAEFILKSAQKFKGYDKGIPIDFDDELTNSIIRGDYSKLKDCNKQIELGLLDALLNSNLSVLEDITDFNIIATFSRIMNNYTLLQHVSNPLALAAFLIFNEIEDYSILNGTKDSKIIQSVLSKNFGDYLDLVIDKNLPYLGRMRQFEVYYEVIKENIEKPIKSVLLSEYFWYKVIIDQAEDLKELLIIDSDIQYFINMNFGGSCSLTNKMKNLNTNMSGSKIEISKNPFNKTDYTSSNNQVNSNMHTAQSNPNWGGARKLENFPSQPKPQLNSLPSQNSYDQQLSIPKSQSFYSPPIRNEQNFMNVSNVYPPMQRPNLSSKIPNNVQQASIPSALAPQPTRSTEIQSSACLNRPQNAFSPPMHPMGTASIPQKPSSSFPSSGSPIGMIPNSQFIPQKPKMPMSPTATRQLENIPSFNMANTPKPPSNAHFQGFSPVGHPSFSQQPMKMPEKSQMNSQFQPRSPLPSIPNNNVSINQRSLDSNQIYNDFKKYIISVQQNAANINSLILKSKKTIYLKQLALFPNDPSNIPVNVMNILDLICKRLESVDQQMKTDLDILIAGFEEFGWLKAFVELVKMVY